VPFFSPQKNPLYQWQDILFLFFVANMQNLAKSRNIGLDHSFSFDGWFT
jgi:hypothetical protein